jgi:hypothetical protein
MMASNQLTSDQRRTARMLGMSVFAAGHGYGMGVAVVMEPDKADPCEVAAASGLSHGRARMAAGGKRTRPTTLSGSF